MTKVNHDGDLILKGNVLCPECEYWGQDYETVKNLTDQSCLKCPECGFVQ